ncbi:MAG: hypothetical protein E7324_07920 [Clostridiales bacterium]|nr:hypothetical protein [Clostridiales bacterium]
MQKKIPVSSELIYVLAILLMSFSVAMVTAADFGVSMIVAPAYILSLKVPGLSFGQSEYIVQGLLFLVMCLLMKKIRPLYLVSFVTCLIYGLALDAWRAILPPFNPSVTPPGSLPMGVRILLFAVATPLTALGVAMFFKAYFYPQVYDFFVKAVAERFRFPRARFKIAFDMLFLVLSVTLSLILFGGFKGIGAGTLITALINGLIIGAAEKMLDKYFVFQPAFPTLARRFSLEQPR